MNDEKSRFKSEELEPPGPTYCVNIIILGAVRNQMAFFNHHLPLYPISKAELLNRFSVPHSRKTQVWIVEPGKERALFTDASPLLTIKFGTYIDIEVC